ncbi:hypothetical protein ABIA31_008593 [Catenulispora sp. MAP5-51]
MKVFGVLSAAALTALGVAASILAVRSLPDLARYIKIRSM